MAALIGRCILSVAAAFAIGVPLFLLQEGEGAAVAPMPVAFAHATPLREGRAAVSALDRNVFAPASPAPAIDVAAAPDEGTPDERPELIGIVGRLPDNAVALVRAEDGRSRTLKAGQTFRGWRLASLGSDAALFVRGSERIRVALDPVT